MVHQPLKGYGNAYKMGFEEARGRYIIMADSDDSYDLTDLERFITPLRDGYDLVMGSRFKGEIKPGAMPPLHRFLGNPVLTRILNILYGLGISDAHSGMRSFTKDAFHRMHLKTEGMEFASEMVIKAAKAQLKITEIPITLWPDGRPGKPHLRSWSDGWRHLRFMLMYDPRHLFSFPGVAFQIVGLVILIAYLSRSLPTLLPGALGSVLFLSGWMIQRFGFYARAHQFTDEFPGWDMPLQNYFKRFSLERSLIIGVVLIIIGLVLFSWALFGHHVAFERLVVLGGLISVFGLLKLFDAFLARILQFVGLK